MFLTCLGVTTGAKWGWKVLRRSVMVVPCFIGGDSSSTGQNHTSIYNNIIILVQFWPFLSSCNERYHFLDQWRDEHLLCSVWKFWSPACPHHRPLPPQPSCSPFLVDPLKQDMWEMLRLFFKENNLLFRLKVFSEFSASQAACHQNYTYWASHHYIKKAWPLNWHKHGLMTYYTNTDYK